MDARTVEGTDKAIYEQIISEYGADSYQASVEVYGEFYDSSSDTFIPAALVKDAQQRAVTLLREEPIVFGVDPARAGKDYSALVVRQGRILHKIHRFKHDSLMDTVGEIVKWYNEWKPQLIVVDEGGLGGGVVDRLKEQQYPVRGVNFAWKSSNKWKFANKRAELWAVMKDWLRTASIPTNESLLHELTVIRGVYD